MTRLRKFVVMIAALAVAGCGGGEPERRTAAAKPAAAAPTGPPKELAAREAFQNMFVTARGWARDARPFQVINLYMKSSAGTGGRAAAWRAGFSSASLGKYRTYTYSTVKAESVHEGVFASHEERYRSESQLAGPPFEVAGFRTDSDKAWKVAEAKGGKAWRAKHPDTPVTFLMEYSRTFQRIVWRVCYDSNCSTSPFTVNVDAASGEFLKVTK